MTDTSNSEHQARSAAVVPRAEPPLAAAVATVLCAVFGIAAAVLHFRGIEAPAIWFLIPAVVSCVCGGGIPLRNAFTALRQRSLNVDVLMIVAAAGAAGIGEWLEAIVLLFLFSLSGTLEAFAMYRTTRSIESLIQLRPLDATRVDGHTEQIVPITSLTCGDVLRVRPGERFPVDGLIEDGETWADESMLTGESEPVVRGPGSMVFAGTINGSGSVLVRMTRSVADTTLERIVHMVQEAQSRRTPSQRFVESWQQPYVIGVLSAALLVLLGLVCCMVTPGQIRSTMQWCCL